MTDPRLLDLLDAVLDAVGEAPDSSVYFDHARDLIAALRADAAPVVDLNCKCGHPQSQHDWRETLTQPDWTGAQRTTPNPMRARCRTCDQCVWFKVPEMTPSETPAPDLADELRTVSAEAQRIAAFIGPETRMLTRGMAAQGSTATKDEIDAALASLVAIGWLVPEAGVLDKNDEIETVEWDDYVKHRDHGANLYDPRTGKPVADSMVLTWWRAGAAANRHNRQRLAGVK